MGLKDWSLMEAMLSGEALVRGLPHEGSVLTNSLFHWWLATDHWGCVSQG